jgi:hypothetical protein
MQILQNFQHNPLVNTIFISKVCSFIALICHIALTRTHYLVKPDVLSSKSIYQVKSESESIPSPSQTSKSSKKDENDRNRIGLGLGVRL